VLIDIMAYNNLSKYLSLERVQNIINDNYDIIANDIVDEIIDIELIDQDSNFITSIYHNQLASEMDNILNESKRDIKEKIQNLDILYPFFKTH
jgi:hypothetical protein